MYKKTVGDSNTLLEKKIKEYEVLVESMLQLDESRITFVKTLLNKNIKYTEYVAKTYLSRVTALSSMIECVNAQTDIEIFVNETDNLLPNPAFIPIECEEYQYK